MLSKWLATMLLMCGAGALQAQGLKIPIAAPALGSSAYAKEPDIFSGIENVASIAIQQTGAAVYAERNYFLSPLQLFSALASFSAFGGGLGFMLNHFGYRNFQASEFDLAYAKKLGPKLCIGSRFNYHLEKIPGYVKEGNLNAGMGVMLYPTSKFSAGIDVYNPVGFGMKENKAPAVIRVGMGYVFSPFFFLSLSVQKIEKLPAAVMLAMRYELNAAAFVEAGFQSSESLIWMACGFRLTNFRLDIRVSRHRWLGYSNGLGIVYSGKKPVSGGTNSPK